MKFEHVPCIPSNARPKKTHDPKNSACVDCGEPVRQDVQRCRECYTVHIRRGIDRRAFFPAGGPPEGESNESAFARMDARFCAAMKKAIEAGLERP